MSVRAATKKRRPPRKKARESARPARALPGPVVNRTELAMVLGVSVRQVFLLESDGVIAPHRRGTAGRGSTYRLATVIPAYIAHVTANSPPQTARARRDAAAAELAELKLQKERRLLLDRDQVEQDGKAFVRGWTAKVRGLPRRLVNAGVVPREQEAAAKAVCVTVLREISTWKTAADIPDEDSDAA